jgi:hypothetical protein
MISDNDRNEISCVAPAHEDDPPAVPTVTHEAFFMNRWMQAKPNIVISVRETTRASAIARS